MNPIPFFKRLFFMILLVLFQVLFFNRINLFGYVTPLIYIWLIIQMDSGTPRYAILLWGFFLGLAIDVFSNTMGINAAACTLLAMLQPVLMKLFISFDRRDVVEPTLISMSKGQYFGYLFIAAFIHHSVYFLFRTFSLEDWSVLIAKIVFSTILTTILLFVFELAFGKKENRHSRQ